MATIDTTYRVINEYTVKDRTGAPTQKMVGNLKQVERQTFSVKRALLGLGAAVGAAGAFALGKKYLIDYNSNLEQTKIQTASLLSLYKGGDVTGNMKVANNIVGELRKRAAASTATTEEMSNFMGRIVGPATKAGLATKDIAKFTADSVIAAKLFGEEMTAGLDIKQALTGQVTVRDRFANQLLDIVGVEKDAFNQMASGDRLAVLQKALQSPVIAQAAKAQGESFAGLTSTLKDNIQQALGKVGVPLMKELSATAKQMVDYLSSSEGMEATKEFAKDFASALVSGFKAIKSIVGFIVEHKTLLLTLAKLWAANKGFSMLKGGITGIGKLLGGGLTGTIAKLGGGLQTLAGKLPFANAQLGILGMKVQAMAPGIGSFIGKLGMVGAALGAVYVAASAFAGWVDSRQTKQLKKDTETSSILNTIEQGAALNKFSKGSRLEQRAKMLGYSSGQQLLDQQAMRARSDLESKGIIKDGKVNRKELFNRFGLTANLQADRVERIIARTNKLKQGREMADAVRGKVQDFFRQGGIGVGEKGLVDDRGGLQRLTAEFPMLRTAIEGLTEAQQRGRVEFLKGLYNHAKNIAPMKENYLMGAASFAVMVMRGMGANLGAVADSFSKLHRSPVKVKIEIPARDPDVFARQFNDAMEQIAASPNAAGAILGNTF